MYKPPFDEYLKSGQSVADWLLENGVVGTTYSFTLLDGRQVSFTYDGADEPVDVNKPVFDLGESNYASTD